MLKFTERAALVAGAATLAAAPTTANAKLVHVTGTPLSVSFMDVPQIVGVNGTPFPTIAVPWDVDGQNGADFSLLGFVTFGTYITAHATFRAGFNAIANVSNLDAAYTYGPLNGLALGQTFNASGGIPFLAPITNSDSVGPGVGGTNSGFFAVGNRAGVVRTDQGVIVSTSSSEAAGGGDTNFNIGFIFESSAGVHAGWANISIAAGPDWSLTVNEWVYEDETETSVHVPDVPVPGSGVAAITLLGLGAAGMRHWRKRKDQTASA